MTHILICSKSFEGIVGFNIFMILKNRSIVLNTFLITLKLAIIQMLRQLTEVRRFRYLLLSSFFDIYTRALDVLDWDWSIAKRKVIFAPQFPQMFSICVFLLYTCTTHRDKSNDCSYEVLAEIQIYANFKLRDGNFPL